MRLVPETSPLPRLLVFPLLVLAVSAWALLRFVPGVALQLAHCPMKDGFGVPCPTCGGTHAAAALAAGEFGAAFAANPIVSGAALLLAAWSVVAVAATIVPAWRRSLVLAPAERKAAIGMAALLALLSWIWQFLR